MLRKTDLRRLAILSWPGESWPRVDLVSWPEKPTEGAFSVSHNVGGPLHIPGNWNRRGWSFKYQRTNDSGTWLTFAVPMMPLVP